jgi:hypothetical protein
MTFDNVVLFNKKHTKVVEKMPKYTQFMKEIKAL